MLVSGLGNDPMTDHRKRNWQRLAHDLCDQWLLRWRWPEGGVGMLTPGSLRKLMREAYMAGYRGGRQEQKMRAVKT